MSKKCLLFFELASILNAFCLYLLQTLKPLKVIFTDVKFRETHENFYVFDHLVNSMQILFCSSSSHKFDELDVISIYPFCLWPKVFLLSNLKIIFKATLYYRIIKK